MALTQANRNIKVTTPLGKDKLLLVGFSADEGVSELFRYDLDLLSEDHAVDFEALIGKAMTVELRTPQGPRYFHGIVRSFQQQESDLELASYRAELVPWLWLLTRTHDCRIFQEKTVPGIVKQVFGDLGFADHESRLEGSYAPRVYCVQYRESDYSFMCRLLEEEGIHFFFAHEDGRHVLVLGDSPSANRPLPGREKVRFHREPRGVQEDDVVLSFVRARHLQPAAARLTDYNFETPQANLTAQRAAEKGDKRWEIYDYPGEYENAEQGGRYARLRLEEQSSGLEQLTGASLCRNFVPGFRMQLESHPRSDLNAAYLLTGLSTRVTELGGYRPGQSGGTDFSYQNQFRALPHGKYHRPARTTPRPVVQGPQTAVVVGPAGEEIYTDKYGRVKVQFHWDREGKRDDKSSCWLRVSQNWAGKNWGAFFLPRIGQEVIVDFLEADPDRPIVTGRVYHAESMPPLDLPAEKTRSAIKTRGTEEASRPGCNEIRFEDKKGEEQLFIQGQKDLDLRIKNDRREWTGNDRHQIVKRDSVSEVDRDMHALVKRDVVEEIKRDHHLTIDGKEAIKVSGSHSLSVQGDVAEEFKGNHSEQVTQNYYLKGMNVVIEGMTGLTIKVGGSFITLNAAGVQISGPMLMINSGGAPLVGIPGAVVPPTAPIEALVADVAAVAGASVATFRQQQAALTPEQRVSAAAPSHDKKAEENKDKKSWIEIELVDEAGNPVPGERYRITLPDGKTVDEGTLDEKGCARVECIDSGTCKITFPELDRDAWKPA